MLSEEKKNRKGKGGKYLDKDKINVGRERRKIFSEGKYAFSRKR